MKALAVAVVVCCIGAGPVASAAPRVVSASPSCDARCQEIARGKYLAGFTCNDCHTPHWRERDGAIPVTDWLTGSEIGYRGPWGTTYAPNLRLEFSRMSEDQWLFMARTRGGRWPMVWHDVRMLTEYDRRAIFQFVRSLGPKGVPVRDNVPPWQEPATPYVLVLPTTPAPRATP